MVALKKKEILVELKAFGINTTSELKTYIREYNNYYSLQNNHIYSLKEDNGTMESNHTFREKLNRITRVTRIITLFNR